MGDDAELSRLRHIKDAARQKRDAANRDLTEAWDSLSRLQSRYGGRIDQLKNDHDSEYEWMRQAYDEASNCYHNDDHESISFWKEKAEKHKEVMRQLTDERRSLIQELESARAHHSSIRQDYVSTKNDFVRAKEDFEQRLEYLKAQNSKKYPRANGVNEFYNRYNSRRDRLDQYVDRNGDPTRFYPHVHIVADESQGFIFVIASVSSQSHPYEEALPISASGNEVYAAQLRAARYI